MDSGNSNTQNAKYRPDDLSTLKDEIIEQTTHSIKEEISDATEKLKVSKDTLKQRVIAWVSEQFGRLSNTLVTLIFASLAAVLLPIFVKLEVDQEFSHYNEFIVNMVSTLISEEMNQSTKDLRSKNTEISKSMAMLQEKINSLEVDADKNQYSELSNLLTNLQFSFGEKYETINAKIDALENIETKKILYSKSIIEKIKHYMMKGQSLVSNKAGEQEMENWIEEVYYFISLIKIDHLDLTAAKKSLFEIYKMDVSSDSSDRRVQNSIVILKALTEGIQLAKK